MEQKGTENDYISSSVTKAMIRTWGDEEHIGNVRYDDSSGRFENICKSNGKGPPPENNFEACSDKRGMKYKKKRQKKNKLWKYASSMNDFYKSQKKKEGFEEANVQLEGSNQVPIREESDLT
jgi:hypothetical protein